MKSYAVIGDVVGSRDSGDRQALHDRLVAVLADADRRWSAGLRLTVGDEFQGTVPTLGAACDLVLTVRLALLPDHDVRFGIGRGDVRVYDVAEGIEDGPAWWAAREAIDAVRALQRRAVTRHARTAYRAAADADAVDPARPAVEAALLARDELIGRLDRRSLSVLRGVIRGMSQQELARAEGVSASAVSQRVRRDGLGVVATVSGWLAELP